MVTEMSNNGKPEPVLAWTVQLKIPVPVRMARRASLAALGKYLAKSLVESFQTVPPEFVAKSAEKIKADLERSPGSGLVGADGRPYRM